MSANEYAEAPRPKEADAPRITLPQPEEIPERERDDAMGAYLMMFATLALGLPIPLFNLIASVIYFFVNRKTSSFVAFHSLQALLTHVPVVVVNAGLVGWFVAILVTKSGFSGGFFGFLIFATLLNILYVIWSIIALVNARRGRFYYIPFFGRVAFARFYGPYAEARRKPKEWENKPPEGL
jgi:uncharacterized membrane protein